MPQSWHVKMVRVMSTPPGSHTTLRASRTSAAMTKAVETALKALPESSKPDHPEHPAKKSEHPEHPKK